MSKEGKEFSGCSIGCGGLSIIGGLLSVAGLVATLSLGPIDFGRSLYNALIGDTPVLKRQLVSYVREGVRRNHTDLPQDQIEYRLSEALEQKPYNGGPVDPQQVSIEKLWDASEDYAKSWYQRWVWPSPEE